MPGGWHRARLIPGKPGYANRGLNAVVATIAHGRSEMFGVTTAPAAKVVAVFEQIPANGSAGNGGNYYLAADDTYDFGYDFSGPPSVPEMVCSGARYEADSLGHIRFFLAPGSYPASQFYAERNGLFATGSLSGDKMAVHYEDPVDFDDELYQRAASSAGSKLP